MASDVILEGLGVGDVLEQNMDLSFVLVAVAHSNDVRVVQLRQQFYLLEHSLHLDRLNQLILLVDFDGKYY